MIRPENSSIRLRKMELSDMKELMRLKNAESWNQTENDWRLLIQYKNSINLVAETDNTIIGTVTAINYANTVAWIGMMLVDKIHRGKGISKILLNETIEKLKDCRSIKLDATPAGWPVYKKLGFIDEYSLCRMTCPSVLKPSLIEVNVKTEQLTEKDIPEVAKLDKQVFGADRTELIYYLHTNSPSLAFLTRENNKITGFSLGRKGQSFTQVGPVYASSDNEAKALIKSSLSKLRGKAVAIDIHIDKPEIENLLSTFGFTRQRTFKRMYLQKNPSPGIIKYQYLISGPELG